MTDHPQPIPSDVELSLAVGFWLGRHPNETAAHARLALTVRALDGASLPPLALALWEAARRRAGGEGNDDPLRAALTAYCADNAARNPPERMGREPPPTPALKPVRNTVVPFAARSAAAMERRGRH